MTLKIRGHLIVLVLFLFAACATNKGVRLEENQESLADLKRTITSLIGDPRILSQNQREITSQYVETTGAKLRHYYHVLILGSRRPYTIEIHAHVEERRGSGFVGIGEDTILATKLAKDIQTKLNQSREGRNVIDDFRAF